MGQLRIWWIPQIPMAPFYVAVEDIKEAKLILKTLADYDLFQYKNKVKPDYSNVGGLEVFDGLDWVEWEDEEGNNIDEVEQ